MPLQTKDLFENATHIAETRISHARAEQTALFWEMVRAAARAPFGKDRTTIEPARVSATAEF
ncbi:hypothetical protein [Silicimonas sp. MF1-12-2]|uniref:hypothetical protein n=1 Tax=Silicimonas sp. MF1-12-2 TaxID=3384793 RepID=UPI0039B4CECF